MEESKTTELTDIEKVNKWLENIYNKARDAYNQKNSPAISVDKFPVKLVRVDKKLFEQVSYILYWDEPFKYAKILKNMCVNFAAQTFLTDNTSLDEDLLKQKLKNGDLMYFLIYDLDFWKISINFHEKDVVKFKELFNNTVSKKEVEKKKPKVSKPVVVTDDLTVQVAKYSKNQSQAKACEKFNLSMEEVKQMCSEYRKQNASK